MLVIEVAEVFGEASAEFGGERGGGRGGLVLSSCLARVARCLHLCVGRVVCVLGVGGSWAGGPLSWLGLGEYLSFWLNFIVFLRRLARKTHANRRLLVLTVCLSG